MKQVRTYRVRGTRREGYNGYSSDTIDVEAFTAADALVQVKLKHGDHFSASSIDPVEPQEPAPCDDAPDGRHTCEFPLGHEGMHGTDTGKRW